MKLSKGKFLAAAIIAFLGSVTGASAASYTETQTINGNVTYDSNTSITVYSATDAAGFQVKESGANATVTMGSDGKGTVHIRTETGNTGNSKANGITIDPNTQLTVNGNVDISSVYGGSCFANGITIYNGGSGEGAYSKITINGNVNIGDASKQSSLTDSSTDKNWGVNAAEMHGGYGPDGHVVGPADDYTGVRWSPTGISITANGKGSTIDINGSLYIAMRGTALQTDPYYAASGESAYDTAIINANGGDVTIYTPESTTESYLAAASYGGTVNINMNNAKTAGAGHKVTIQGNLLAMKDYNSSGQPYFYQDGRVNLALDTSDSTWTGVVDNSGKNQAGEVNFWLQNGASWIHRSLSKTNAIQAQNLPSPSSQNHYGVYDGVTHLTTLHGGADESTAGNIFPTASTPIQIGNYSGYTNVYYAHTGNGESSSNYAAGDITIGSAAVGSVISLITDNSGVTMTNEDNVARVLQALAGKLTYSAYASGERNLSGTVKIADGLTASSSALKIGNLSFTDTGKGNYIKGDDPGQSVTEFTTPITGVKANDGAYVQGGVLFDEGEHYIFTKDSTINNIVDSTTVAKTAAINIAGDVGHAVDINAAGKTLTINTTSTGNAKDQYGIAANSLEGTTITAGKLVVNAISDNGRIEGFNVGAQGQQNADNANKLTVNGDLDLNVQGIGYTLGLYATGNSEVTFNGNVTAMGGDDYDWGLHSKNGAWGYYGCSLIYSGSNYNLQMGPKVTINGDVNAKIDGNGLFGNGGHAKLTINGGGYLEVNKENTHNYYALLAECATTSMNVNLDENYIATSARTNDLVLKGNVTASTGAMNANEPELYTYVNLGLATKDSEWTGVAYNKFGDAGKTSGNKTFYGSINVWLQNGATWNNEAWGAVETGAWGAEPWSGSHLAKLVGGDSEANAGNIFQNDTNPITIDNISGYTNVYYAHTGNGEAASDYANGDLIIRSAAEGSQVTLVTDSTGVTLDNDDSVDNVLNALAGKLYYKAYVNNETNLTGQVKIADGLTSSSQTKWLGQVLYTDGTGQAYLDIESVQPPEQTRDSFTEAITGDKATDKRYTRSGVRKADGTYVFTKDSTTITTEGHEIVINKGWGGTTVSGNAAISGADADHKVSIDLKGHDLTVDTKSGITTTGISAIGDGVVDVNHAGDMSITAESTASWMQAAALFANLGGTINIHNEGKLLKLRATGMTPSYVAVIKTMNGVSDGMSSIVVDGLVDVLADKGTTPGANEALSAVASKIEVGGGSIKAVNGAAYAIRAYGEFNSTNRATVNVNVAKDADGNITGAGENKVEMEGDICLGGGMDNGAMADVSVGLNTADSAWTGNVIKMGSQSNQGTVNLYMGNGATWTGNNTAASTVNAKLDNATWTGYSTGTAMNLSLESDATWNVTDGGSGAASQLASLTGANGNIFMTANAGDLTISDFSGYANIYYAHEGNGEDEANYTAGNTIIEKAAKGANISLITDNTGVSMDNDENIAKVLNALAGKLHYNAYVTGETNLSGQVKIADGLTASSKAQVLGNILFDTTTGKGYLDADTIRTPEQSVDTFSKVITGDATNDKIYTRYGVRQTTNGNYVFTMNPSKVTISDEPATVSAEENDIVILAPDAALTLENTAEGGMGIFATDGTSVSVTGKDTTVSAEDAIVATNDATVTLTGDTTITAKDMAISSGAGAAVTVSGGKATITGALDADGGLIKIGDEKGIAAKSDLFVSGDGEMVINVIGSNSTLEGGYKVEEGKLTVNVQKGGLWTLKDSAQKNSAVTRSLRAAATSGTLDLNGGASESEAGNIKMEATEKQTISDYSGYLNVYYAHTGNGEDTANYTAGDLVITNAAAGSQISLITDNTGVTYEEENVAKVLNALAGKLYYSAYVNGATNLTGKVKLADGLTASSKSLQMGDIEFQKDKDGQGKYKEGSMTPGFDGMSSGDYETYVMKGVRSAATTMFHAWRDNMQDTYRAADLVDEDGIFAKVLGGKTESDVKGVNETNTYKGVQVGYDKVTQSGWHAGIAFDYCDGDSDYLLGGKGDDKLYSFGFYGVKSLADNRYFRVAAKVGRVENKYDVYNETRMTSLHGDYGVAAFGITAEYGKTFATESSYLTPKVQFTWAHVGGKDYTAMTAKDDTMDVFQDAYQSFVGRVGVEAGLKKAKGHFYGGLYLAHEFGGDVNSRYYAKDGGWKSTAFDGNDSWVELVLGGSYQAGSRAQIYADFARDFGGDFEHQWKLDAGVRFSF